MYQVYGYVLLLLVSFIYECGSFGVVYRTGCCPNPNSIPDTAKRTSDFIEAYGFRAEIHEIVTEDGYILSLHRVLPRFSDGSPRPAVLVQHGAAGSSSLWLMKQEKSLPFLLTEAGFDTWIGDSRGNSYSGKHVFLRSSDPAYWQFGFHEQGTLDLPAAVDYIINVTNNQKIFYLAHSRGTTMALTLLSTRPEYNNKFHLLTFYAPVAYIRHVHNPFLTTIFNSGISPAVQGVVKNIGVYQLPGSSVSSIQIREIFCNRTQLGCISLVFFFSGFDYELLNKSMIPVFLAHYPEGGSTQEYLHFLQIAQKDEFVQYDYGPRKNVEVYGSAKPPLYDLSKVTAPIALYYGDNDFLVRPKDRNRLRKQLRSVVADVRIPYRKFSHMDFVWATKADVLVYRPTIEFMRRFYSTVIP